MPKIRRIKLDTSKEFPEPEVFAAMVEKHVLDAQSAGFDVAEITYHDPAKGWMIMNVDLHPDHGN